MRILALLILGLSLAFQGYSQLMDGIDQLSPFHDGLASVKKGNQWGFMDSNGKMAVDFRNDLVSSPAVDSWSLAGAELKKYPVFHEDRCLFSKEIDGIRYYGYIDKSGKEAIAPTYVNATNFKNGYAIVMVYTKEVVGKNQLLGKDVVEHKVEEMVIDTSGKVVTPLFNEKNYVPEKIKSSPPPITGKFLGNNLVAVQNEDQKWMIYQF